MTIRTHRGRLVRVAFASALAAIGAAVAGCGAAWAATPHANPFASFTAAGTTSLVAGPAASSLQDAASGTPIAISADGRYVAFASRAKFTPDASPLALNLFLRDTQTDVTTLVSRSDRLSGAAADGGVDFTNSGRTGIAIVPGALALDAPHDVPHVMVVFASKSTNLVDHATGAVDGSHTQVWLRDLTAGTTRLVSRADGLTSSPGDGESRSPSIAVGPSGPLVAFNTNAPNLGVGGPGSVVLREIDHGHLQLVSCAHQDCSGAPTETGVSLHPSLRVVDGGDGGALCPAASTCVEVAFTTQDPDIDGDASGHTQVMVAGAFTGPSGPSTFALWELASRRHDTVATPGNGDSADPALGVDGQVVAFRSSATDLTNPEEQPFAGHALYVHLLRSFTVERGRNQFNKPLDVTDVPAIGGPGFVSPLLGFTTDDPFFNNPQPNQPFRAYEMRLNAAAPTLLDRASGQSGAVGDGVSSGVAVSTDGSSVAFASNSTNLGAGGGSDFQRVYVRRVADDSLELVSRPTGTGPFSAGGQSASITTRAVSANGRYVAFESQDDTLSTADNNRFVNVFVRDMVTRSVTLVSRANGATGLGANSDSQLVGISDDGRRVAFTSEASNLTAETVGHPASSHVFVRDLVSGQTTLVSRVNGPTGSMATGTGYALSGDGQHVVFQSAHALDPADDGFGHLYERDLANQTTTLVDRDQGVDGRVAPLQALDAAVDYNGSRVAWVTQGQVFHAGGALDGPERIYLRDLPHATTVLVSRANGANGAQLAGEARAPSIDGTGNRVAFELRPSAPTSGGFVRIMVRDIAAGTTATVSRRSGSTGQPANGDSFEPSMNKSGDRIAFVSDAGNLGAGQQAIGDFQAYMRTISSAQTDLVSRANGLTAPPVDHPGFGAVSLSADGACAAFSARGLNIGDGFANAVLAGVHLRAIGTTCPGP